MYGAYGVMVSTRVCGTLSSGSNPDRHTFYMEVYFNVNALNIIISPHLDDAVISMGGFILKNFKNTKIITIFSGKPEKKKYTI